MFQLQLLKRSIRKLPSHLGRFGFGNAAKLLMFCALILFFSTSVFATNITITGLSVQGWRGGATCSIRVFANNTFHDSAGNLIVGAATDSKQFYLPVLQPTCTVSGNTVTVGSFVLPATTDSIDNPNATYSLAVFEGTGNTAVKRITATPATFRVPHELTPLTWSKIVTINSTARTNYPQTFPTTQQVLQLLAGIQGQFQPLGTGSSSNILFGDMTWRDTFSSTLNFTGGSGRIKFTSGGEAAPAAGNPATGSRICFYCPPGDGGNSLQMGVENNSLWQNVGAVNTYKFYWGADPLNFTELRPYQFKATTSVGAYEFLLTSGTDFRLSPGATPSHDFTSSAYKPATDNAISLGTNTFRFNNFTVNQAGGLNLSNGTTAVNLFGDNGAPAASSPNGSIYFRRDAPDANQTIYFRAAGAWHAQNLTGMYDPARLGSGSAHAGAVLFGNQEWRTIDGADIQGGTINQLYLPNNIPQTKITGLTADLSTFNSAIANLQTGKADVNSANLLGNPTAPTATAGDNDTTLATTGFVQNALSGFSTLPTQTGNNGKYLTTNGTAASWGTVTATPMGAATGDLTGSYPNPSIAKVQGRTLTLPTLPAALADEFNSYDTLIWNTATHNVTPLFSGGYYYGISDGSGSTVGIHSDNTYNFSGKTVIWEYDYTGVASASSDGINARLTDSGCDSSQNIGDCPGTTGFRYLPITSPTTITLYYNYQGNVGGVYTEAITLSGLANKFRLQDSAGMMIYSVMYVGSTTWTVIKTYDYAGTTLYDTSLQMLSAVYFQNYAGSQSPKLDRIETDVYTVADTLADKSMLWWNQSGNRFEDTTLTGLKTALEALGISASNGLPAQTGNAGKILTTDGTAASWSNFSNISTNILSDDFNSGSFSNLKWTTPVDADIQISSGKVSITKADTANGFVKTLNQTLGFDKEFIVEAVTVPLNTGHHTQFLIADGDSFTNNFSMQVLSGTLQCHAKGVLIGSGVSYNATNHRWWKIKIRYGNIFYETSPNGSVWTPLFVTPINGNVFQVFTYLRTVNSSGATRTAEFDNFSINSFPGS